MLPRIKRNLHNLPISRQTTISDHVPQLHSSVVLNKSVLSIDYTAHKTDYTPTRALEDIVKEAQGHVAEVKIGKLPPIENFDSEIIGEDLYATFL